MWTGRLATLALCVCLGCSGGSGTKPGGAGGAGGAPARAAGGTAAAGAPGGGGGGQSGAAGGAAGHGGESAAAGTGGSPPAPGGAAGGAAGAHGVAGNGGGSAGSRGAAGAGGAAATGGGPSAGGRGGTSACQNVSIQFSPRAPSVEILVDRAGAEFTTATTGTFFDLRAALLAAVAQYQSEMRIGFAAYVGDRSTGTCALNYTSVPIASQNAAAIEATYQALGPVQPFGSKSELPASAAIPKVADTLQADPSAGDKFILFATTGSTDFCDDGIAVCPMDAVVGRLQSSFASGLRTVVVGLPLPLLPQTSALQSFANAGAGQPVSLPTGTTAVADIYDQCSTAASWIADWTAAGRTGTNPIATYAASAGTAPVYRAGAASTPDLPSAINAAFASMRTCLFDLAKFQIDPARVGDGTVSIDGAALPLDPTDGWSMPNAMTVRLNGRACATWRAPASGKIAFAFPCDAVQIR